MNTYRYRSFTVAKHDSHSIVSCRRRQREREREIRTCTHSSMMKHPQDLTITDGQQQLMEISKVEQMEQELNEQGECLGGH